ncbi:hypothetical protein [Arcticibacter tournemirensis]
MTKEKRSFPKKHNRHSAEQRFTAKDRWARPMWMKIIRGIAIVLLSIFLVLAVIGMILHAISHFR